MAGAEARMKDIGGRRRTLLLVPPEGGAFGNLHDRTSRRAIAERLAALLGFAFGGEAGEPNSVPGAYYVPAETLLRATAERLGIHGEGDLFGGVVPFPFVASKAITHDLPSEDAVAPAGWCGGIASLAADAVLSGYTVFNRCDALEAGLRLLGCGPVRVKPAAGVGGHGQVVARTREELNAAFARLDWTEAGETGLALEEDLAEATTFSVGQIRVPGSIVSYVGVQRQTIDEEGSYAGSILLCTRGDHEALLDLDLPEDAGTAIAQARAYDAAVARLYPAFFASRRNYDVAVGRGCDGRIRSGVLEQSWRLGGASGAEVLALEALRKDPTLRSVKGGTFELEGDANVPGDALVLFKGTDPVAGPLTKYAALLA